MNRKLCWILACLLAMSMVLVGCGGSKDLGGSRWEADSIYNDEESYSGDEIEDRMGKLEIVFVDDDTFFIGVGDETAEGTYTLDGNELTMVANGVIQEAELQGDTLILYGDNDVEMSFKRK